MLDSREDSIKDEEEPIVIAKKQNRRGNRHITNNNSGSESDNSKKLHRHNSQHTRHNRKIETEKQREYYTKILSHLDFRYKLLRDKYGETILKNNTMMDFIVRCKDEKVFFQYANYLKESDRQLLWHYVKLYQYFLETFHQHITYVTDKAHTMSVPKMKEHIRALRAYIDFAQQYYKEASLLQCAKNEAENEISQSEAVIWWDDWDEGTLEKETKLNIDIAKKNHLSSPQKKPLAPENTKEKAFFSLMNTKLLHFQRNSKMFLPKIKESEPDFQMISLKRSTQIREEDFPSLSCLFDDTHQFTDEVKDLSNIIKGDNAVIEEEEKERKAAAIVMELRHALNIFSEHTPSTNNKAPLFMSVHRALNLFEKEKSKYQELKTSQPTIGPHKTIGFFNSKERNEVTPDPIKLYRLTRRRTLG